MTMWDFVGALIAVAVCFAPSIIYNLRSGPSVDGFAVVNITMAVVFCAAWLLLLLVFGETGATWGVVALWAALCVWAWVATSPARRKH